MRACACAACLLQVLFVERNQGGGAMAELSQQVAARRMREAVQRCMQGLLQVCGASPPPPPWPARSAWDLPRCTRPCKWDGTPTLRTSSARQSRLLTLSVGGHIAALRSHTHTGAGGQGQGVQEQGARLHLPHEQRALHGTHDALAFAATTYTHSWPSTCAAGRLRRARTHGGGPEMGECVVRCAMLLGQLRWRRRSRATRWACWARPGWRTTRCVRRRVCLGVPGGDGAHLPRRIISGTPPPHTANCTAWRAVVACGGHALLRSPLPLWCAQDIIERHGQEYHAEVWMPLVSALRAVESQVKKEGPAWGTVGAGDRQGGTLPSRTRRTPCS